MTIDSMIHPLTAGLRERGFELLVAVSIAAPIETKINVIREVRMLTGFGLKEAKDAVEGEQIILDSLAPDQAEWVSQRLAAAGAHSAHSLARAHLYAFVPKHGSRAVQRCERLTVVGPTLEIAQGQLGTWDAPRALPVGDAGLLAAIDRQRATWEAAGFSEAGSEIEILRRVSARNDQLEARICAAEGDALVHEAAVYGDWLLGKGDARGLVASSALSLAAAQTDDERAQRAYALTQILAEHVMHVFGSARAMEDFRCMRLEWTGPMITSVEFIVTVGNELEHTRLLEHLLALPACAGLRRLALWPRLTEHVSLGGLLTQSGCASSLRSLWVTNATRVSMANVKFERLESLDLAGQDIDLAELSVPALRRLSLELQNRGAALVNCFVGLDAPSLEHFAFTAYEGYLEQEGGPLQSHLAALLRLPAFARLRSLTLRSVDRTPPYQRGLWQLFAQLPAKRTLEYIDLRQATLTPEARAELEAARSLLPNLLLE